MNDSMDPKQSVLGGKSKDLSFETSEGDQEMGMFESTSTDELGLEYGSTLRLSEGIELDPNDMNFEISPVCR